MCKRVIIVAGGWIKGPEFLMEVIQKGDLIIAVDGGFSYLREAGIVPHILMGDIDSLKEGDYNLAIKKGVKIFLYPGEKDKTDTEIALEHALSMNPKEIKILGGIGDRIDHTISNLGLLLNGLMRKVPIFLMDGRQLVFIAEGFAEVIGEKGDWVSLIPFTQRVDGIKTEGLKYPLMDEGLEWGKSRGISNELTEKRGKIIFSSGILIVVHIRRRL
jgi:thiamine pyrophosphokinase